MHAETGKMINVALKYVSERGAIASLRADCLVQFREDDRNMNERL